MAPEAIEARPKSTKQNQKSSPNSLEKTDFCENSFLPHIQHKNKVSRAPDVRISIHKLVSNVAREQTYKQNWMSSPRCQKKTLEMKIPTPEIGKHPIHDHHVVFRLLPKTPKVPARYLHVGIPSTNMEVPGPASPNSGHRKLLPYPVSELKMFWKLTPEASE